MNFSESPRAGDFILDSSPVPPKLDLAGARSHFYRAAQTPSAASSLCRSITPNQGSRKRTRYGYDDNDTSGGLENTAFREDRSGPWGDQSTLSLSGIASPSPLASTQYRLAGGVPESQRATSGIASLTSYEDLDNSGTGPEVDYRPSRYQNHGWPAASDPNSRKRSRPSSSSSNTLPAEKAGVGPVSERNWGKVVISLVGDVAVKVWDFCWTGTFRGFYAGGGQGYSMAPGASSASDASKEGENIQMNQNHEPFREKHFGHQPDQSRDELRSDWVLVKNTEPSHQESPSQSSRKTPRRGSVPHHAPSRRAAARPIASAKRPSLATPTRSSPYRHQHSSSLGSKPDKPMSAETQRHVAKIRKQEREEDASIQRLNQQLNDMIRQGKEALGTRIEVDEMNSGDSD